MLGLLSINVQQNFRSLANSERCEKSSQESGSESEHDSAEETYTASSSLIVFSLEAVQCALNSHF